MEETDIPLLLPLKFNEYQEDIKLFEECQPTKGGMIEESDQCVYCQLTSLLIQGNVECKHSEDQCFNTYITTLFQMNVEQIKTIHENKEIMKIIHNLLSSIELPQVDVMKLNSFRKEGHSHLFKNNLYLYKGDIASLNVDAIVCEMNHDFNIMMSQEVNQRESSRIRALSGIKMLHDLITIHEKQGFDEPISLSVVTRSYHLPCKYLFHSVVPNEFNTKGYSAERYKNLIHSSYLYALSLADRMKLQSIAIPIIPCKLLELKKNIALLMKVTEDFLTRYRFTTLKKIVFVCRNDYEYEVFNKRLVEDDFNMAVCRRYLYDVQDVTTIREPTEEEEKEITKFIEFFKKATHIVIGVGAGFSVDAGLDFNDEYEFAHYAHGILKYDVKDMYNTFRFNDYDSQEELWGIYASCIKTLRFTQVKPDQFDYHKQLLELLQQYNKDYFVITTNMDGMIERSGFDMNKVFIVQGDYNYIQCVRGCTKEHYEFIPYMNNILKHYDPFTQKTTSECAPKCPRCGGNMIRNTRKNEYFVEEPFFTMEKPYDDFVEGGLRKGIIMFIELGVGYATPGIIRQPFDDNVFNTQSKSMLVRNNSDVTMLDTDTHNHDDKYLKFGVSSKLFIKWIHDRLMSK